VTVIKPTPSFLHPVCTSCRSINSERKNRIRRTSSFQAVLLGFSNLVLATKVSWMIAKPLVSPLSSLPQPMFPTFNAKSRTSCDQWLKWFCEAGGRAHLTKPGWSKPHTHSNPTNLASFRHKITLYRFNQGGGSYYCRGAQMGAGGLSPLAPSL